MFVGRAPLKDHKINQNDEKNRKSGFNTLSSFISHRIARTFFISRHHEVRRDVCKTKKVHSQVQQVANFNPGDQC